MDAQTAEQVNSGMKRRLGRGLNALLGGVGAGDESEAMRPATIPMHVSSAPPAPASDEISLELIERNPFQPRRDFEQLAIDELADSIRKHGILQPLLVRARPDGHGYQLIAGERRWRAAQQVGMDTVPCRVIEFGDRQASEAALEENMKREDLNVLEKARAFKEYLDRFGGTIEDLARQLSMSRANVSNMMRLLELPDAVQKLLRSDKISGGHAKAILPLSEAQQIEMARQIESEQMSVRRTEEIVRDMLKAGTIPLPVSGGSSSSTSDKPSLSNHVLGLQDSLRDTLGAKIDIKLKKNDAGQIVIHFGNNDDFERIVGKLRKAS